MPEELKRKVLLLGDGAVGKTSLIRRYVTDAFSDDYIATIGTKVTKKQVSVERATGPVDVTMMIWDVLGQQEYTRIQEGAFASAAAALLVYDVTRVESYDSLKKFWIRRLWNVAGKVPVVVLGNKCDLIEHRPPELSRLLRLTESLQVPGWLVSAKTGENVDLAFLALAGLTARGAEESKKVQVQLGTSINPYAPAAVADKIMMDFCNSAGGLESGMPIVRQVFTLVGMDVRAPTKEALRKVIDSLSEVEADLQTKEQADAAKARRLEWIADIPD